MKRECRKGQGISMGRLQDRVAIVAGAGSSGPGWGNGKAAAVTFAREGAQIFAIDINEAAVAETTDIIRKEGGTSVYFVPTSLRTAT